MTRLLKTLSILLLFLLPALTGMAQDPGGNPDGPPPAVPFDDYMLPLLLIAGAGLVMVLFKRIKKVAEVA